MRSLSWSLIISMIFSNVLIPNSIFSQTQDPPDFYQYGYVVEKMIDTDSGQEFFLCNQFSLDGANYSKIFGETPFSTTLYHAKRRVKCYKYSLLIAAQLPVNINPSNSNGIDKKLRIMEKVAAKSGEVIDFWDQRQINYRSADDLASITDNFINKYLRRINPKSYHGVKFKTTNLQHLSNALKVLKFTTISVDFAYHAAVREALATDEALTRLSIIENVLHERRNAGEIIDPVIFEALHEARSTIETSDTYYGALLMEMTDRKDELISMGITGALQYVKKHYVADALAKYYAHHATAHLGTKAAATKASTVAGLWTWSIILTYETIKGLLDQHEKMQTGITSATLSSLLNAEIRSGRLFKSEIVKAMIWHAEYMYYDQMTAVFSGALPAFRDFIDNMIYDEKYNKEWKLYFGELREDEELAIQALDIFDYPEIEISSSGITSIGFILDSSGSMRENDPNNIRKTALLQIIDLLKGNENIYLVEFDEYSSWLNSQSWKDWSPSDLKSLVHSIDSDGSTNIGQGIKEMQDAFETTSVEGSNAAVMLLTDGLNTVDYNDEADWFALHNIPVYTVSYGQESDADLMDYIANQTNGKHVNVLDEEHIISAFMQFFHELIGMSKLYSYTGSISSGSIETEYFSIDQSCTDLVTMLNWTGQTLDYQLVNPAGKILDPYQFGEIKTGDSYKLLRVNDPEPGQWKAVITTNMVSGSPPTTELWKGDSDLLAWNNQMASESINYTKNLLADKESISDAFGYSAISSRKTAETEFIFEASSDSKISLKLDEIESSAPGLLSYKLSNETGFINIDNCSAEINLITPEGKNVDISSNFKAGGFSFMPLEGEGNYTIQAQFRATDLSGNQIDRYFTQTSYVGEFIPGYLGQVTRVMGNYIFTSQGSFAGNKEGNECYVYKPEGTRENPLAKGYVTRVTSNECVIEIQRYFSSEKVTINDIVELDKLQWIRDY